MVQFWVQQPGDHANVVGCPAAPTLDWASWNAHLADVGVPDMEEAAFLPRRAGVVGHSRQMAMLTLNCSTQPDKIPVARTA